MGADERKEEPHSTFVLYSLRTNQVMKMQCAEYYNSNNFACSVFNDIRYTAYHQRKLVQLLLKAYHTPSQQSPGIILVLLHLPHYLYHISNAISSTAQSEFTN